MWACIFIDGHGDIDVNNTRLDFHHDCYIIICFKIINTTLWISLQYSKYGTTQSF